MLDAQFRSWEPKYREEFLDFCSGQRGCKLIYDSFFREILHPEHHQDRVENLLSLLIGQQVKIVQTLSNEHRISSGTSLLIMDIVVQLQDGSIANVEMQRVGYAFPGERTACYSADLLLRQYHRVRQEKGRQFSYRDIKKVYTIVLFEKSPELFKAFPKDCLHRGSVRFDTGLPVEIPQEFIYVALDIFRKITQNTGIRSELDAWLTFLSMDEPEAILELITKFSNFKPMYEEVYRHCLNLEDIMGFFSEELLEMDRITEMEMREEAREDLKRYLAEIVQSKEVLDQLHEEISRGREELVQLHEEMNQTKEQLRQLDQYVSELQAKLSN